MPKHCLNLIGDPANVVWSLQWDDKHFELIDPNDYLIEKIETRRAHGKIDLSMVSLDGTIAIDTFFRGKLLFQQNARAIIELQELVNNGLRSDPEYRASMRSWSVLATFLGAAAFLIGGGLFGGFCWFASQAPEPPPEPWIHLLRWPVKVALIALMCTAVTGLIACISGLRRWMRIRGIERSMEVEDRLVTPG